MGVGMSQENMAKLFRIDVHHSYGYVVLANLRCTFLLGIDDMRVSWNNERFWLFRWELRDPLLRVVISFDKASPMCGHSVFETNSLCHLDTTIVEAKLAFGALRLRMTPTA